MKNKRPSLPPIAYLSIAIVLLWGGNQIWQLINPSHPDRDRLTERRSSGERQLIEEIDSSAKLEGINSFDRGDYSTAIQQFQASLKEHRNDPETQIYLQNSIARKKASNKTVKVAIVAPIGSNSNIAQEMLRGISMLQIEVNQRGGINGMPLELEIFRDDNDPNISRQVAERIIRELQIVGVVGSNTSDASLAAAPIYDKAGLVMITPTSVTRDLTGIGNYILRTTPTSSSLANTLAHQIYTVDRHRKLAICFDSKASDSETFKDDLIAAFSRLGGEVAGFTCDVGAADFNPHNAIDKAKSHGADSLFIASHIDRLPLALQVATANNGSLPLYSSPTLNTYQTLQAGHPVSGLTLVTPWASLPRQSGSFAERSQRLWGGQVSWRTALSYDAGMAIVTGLRQSNGTRLGLQQALHHPQFSAEGASDPVKFLPTGDRVLQPKIVRIQQVDGKWAFVPLPVSATNPQPVKQK